MDNTIDRVKVCYACAEYIPINTNSAENLEKIKLFETYHRGHTTQTISIKELRSNYRLFKV